jgi:hypothetical protein
MKHRVGDIIKHIKAKRAKWRILEINEDGTLVKSTRTGHLRLSKYGSQGHPRRSSAGQLSVRMIILLWRECVPRLTRY